MAKKTVLGVGATWLRPPVQALPSALGRSANGSIHRKSEPVGEESETQIALFLRGHKKGVVPIPTALHLCPRNCVLQTPSPSSPRFGGCISYRLSSRQFSIRRDTYQYPGLFPNCKENRLQDGLLSTHWACLTREAPPTLAGEFRAPNTH